MTTADTYIDLSVLSPVNIVARESDEPRDWYFTFGAGHRAYSASTSYPMAGKGFSLARRYVVLHGTFQGARERMCEIFGSCWAFQYGTPESAGVEEWNLTELVVTDGR